MYGRLTGKFHFHITSSWRNGQIQASYSLVDNEIPFEIPSPYCSFTAHTLTVTDLVVGFGLFPTCRVMSSSLDCTVKVTIPFIFIIHPLKPFQVWDVQSHSILSTFVFPAPIICLAWDRTERLFFAASHKSSIYKINLYQKKKDGLQSAVAAMEALGGRAASGEQIQISTLDAETSRLIPIG